jgi:mannose-6-phosphate isomerase-like protein (cupin superfamily)
MTLPATVHIDETLVERAPDGSRVRPLLALESGSMAQFELNAGQVSQAVRHRSVDEIWLVLSGHGELWRQAENHESIVVLEPGVCVSIPAATVFQFRCATDGPLRIAAVTMPQWPGDSEAGMVPGKWR